MMPLMLALIINALAGAIASEGFCEDYLDCMQRLEAKQNDCLLTERNVQMSSTDLCTRKKWDIKMALNGLHMRRAELTQDCVQKNIKDATISESILDPEEVFSYIIIIENSESVSLHPCEISVCFRQKSEKEFVEEFKKEHHEEKSYKLSEGHEIVAQAVL
ncbi:hypothetical protein GCK32_006009 [Trichostrongylus colubriformis]|uniref:Uncharacterized protein n=1 Tax=Trichostrongylus colubriformis TaxID=6319 RepID=A0AAN8FC81_TRICO